MSKHTPGPWFWVNYDKTKTCRLVNEASYIIMDFERWGMQSARPRFSSRHIPDCKFDIMRATSNANNHPDGRLIAASPDLLDALKEIVKYHERGDWRDNRITDYLNKARAALAKAESE